jgi:hypothetical protein
LNASVEASEPHDFAVRLGAVRQKHLGVHRIPSRVRDDREPPLEWDETARVLKMFLGIGKAEYFSQTDWTAIND